MIEWIGFTAVWLGAISGYLALKNLDSVFKPNIKKRSNPFVFQFYKKLCFSLLIVGTILLAFHYLDFQSWSQETRSKVTLYALVITATASVYTMVQSLANRRRQRDIERRIKNHNEHF